MLNSKTNSLPVQICSRSLSLSIVWFTTPIVWCRVAMEEQAGRCNGGTGRTARAEHRQHTRKVRSASIAQVFVFEWGDNRFKVEEVKKVHVILTLPPLICPYRALLE